MRPLRDLIQRGLPPDERGPVEPIAVLSAIVRLGRDFDAGTVFDRALFGLTEGEVRDLGPVLPHVCEIAFEALERSGLRFDRLRAMRVGTILGVSDPQWVTARDAPFLADLLGVPGRASTIIEAGAGLFAALHLACEVIRSGDLDFALVAGDVQDGVGAVFLARPSLAATGHVRAFILGSAVNRRSDELSARTLAACRAVVDERSLSVAEDAGLAGLVGAVAALSSGLDVRPIGVAEYGEAAAAFVVCGPAAPLTAAPTQPPRILGLAARTPGALRSLVALTLEQLRTDVDLFGVAADAIGRPPHEHRLAAPVTGVEAARGGLAAYLHVEGVDVEGGGPVVEGGARLPVHGYAVEASVAFVVPPAGAQFVQMTDQLYTKEEVYRDALNRMDKALRGKIPRPLLSLLFPDAGREFSLDDPAFANPVTFAVAFALAELLKSRGVVPGAVLGCGVGELAAAAIAGAVDPEDAVRVAAERGRLIASVQLEAGRAVIGASEEDVRELIADQPEVDVMAIPTPERVVVGGARAAVERVLERATAAGLRSRRMAAYPNNTPLVNPIVADFVRAAGTLRFLTPEAGWVSAATARRTEHADGPYWAMTLRGPVRFHQAVETLYSLGCRSFVELSRPALMKAGEKTLASRPAWWFSALQPGVDDVAHLEDVLSSLWVLGTPVERGQGPSTAAATDAPTASSPFVPVYPGAAELPTYPWDRTPLGESEPSRLVAELHRISPETGGAWVPELDEPDDLGSLQTLASIAPVSEPLLELGDGRPTPPSAGRSDDLHLRPLPGDISWAPEPATTLVPVEEREEAPEPEELVRPANRPPSVPPAPAPAGPPVGVVEVLLTTEPAPARTLEIDQSVAVRMPGSKPPEADDESDRQVGWEEGWLEDPISERTPLGDPTTWVILTDRVGVGDYLGKLLAAAGHRVLRVHAEGQGVAAGGQPRAAVRRLRGEEDSLTVVHPSSPEAWAEVVERVAGLGAVRILHLWSLDPPDDALVRRSAMATPAELEASLSWVEMVAFIKALHGAGARARLHFVTRGALKAPDRVTAMIGGALWGLARILAVEMPSLFGGVVELDPEDEDPELLVRHLQAGDAAVLADTRSEYVFRGGQRWRRTVEAISRIPLALPLATDGTWVLGGDIDLAALDLAIALVGRGVGRIFFVSAAAPSAAVLRGVLDLQRKGTACIVVRADPTDERDVGQIVARIHREPRICGVVQRLAARSASVLELDPAEAAVHWRQALAMASLLWSLAPDGQRWLWSEGRSLDGAPKTGVPGVAGEAISALARLPPEGGARQAVSIVHTAPHDELSPGQGVRLVLRLGPVGGVHGVWRRG